MGLRTTQERRQFSATKARTQKEIEVANISRNIGNRRKREILRTADNIPASRNDRNQKSNQGCLGDVSQVQTGADNADESALFFFFVIVPAVSNDTWIQRNNVEANSCCFHRISVFGVRFHVVKNRPLQDTSQD